MAAADKLNGAYWRKRAIELAEKQKQEDDDLCLRFHREYERILHELDKELSIFYARYAANESVSMADARRLLRDAELEDFRMSLDEFRNKALAGGFDKELEEVYLRSRISRLQALQTQVELRMMELFSSQRDVLRDHLQERYTDTYYRTVYAVSQQADVVSTFARIDPQTVEKILAMPWVGSEFSSRIWADKDKRAVGTGVLGDEIDLNDVDTSGMYRVQKPKNGVYDYGQLLVVHGYGDTIAQVCFDYAANRCAVRCARGLYGASPKWEDWTAIALCAAPEVHELPLADGITSNNIMYYKSQEGIVTVVGSVAGDFPASQSTVIGNVPEGFRPAYMIEVPAAFTMGATGNASVDASGHVSVAPYLGGLRYAYVAFSYPTG